MVRLTRLSVVISLLYIGACASGPDVRDLSLVDGGGAAVPVTSHVGDSGLAVLVFFSARCPCQRAHDARLVTLAERWAPRGVPFVAVASEAGLGRDDLARERAARGYPFPLVADPDARLARALGATFATHVVIVDAAGRVRMSGAIDSDAVTLHDDATPYLERALVALTTGQPLADGGRAKGCVLRKP
jgi:hypothetical protein